ncbi:MAG: hypothetical protein JWR10_958 [Rubritepida sp.]|nr:hypothetical protein [Rubritepida sp.]
MKRFMVVPALGSAWRQGIVVFLGFPRLPVLANTFCGHIGAVLAGIPTVRALFTGGRVGIYETGVGEL